MPELPLKKVLLATDFSPASANALAHAAAFAARHGAELHVLHVLVLLQADPGRMGDAYDAVIAYQAALHEIGEADLAAVEAATDVPVVKVTRRGGDVAEAVVDYAREVDCDLIVVGTHARRGIRHTFLGSVAAEIVRHAPVSVLVVGSAGGGDEDLPPYDVLLAPTDFSPGSEQAFRVAADICETQGARFVAVHVVPPVSHPAAHLFGPDSLFQAFPDLEKRARARLATMTADAAAEGTTTDVIVAEGPPHRKIVELAREHGANIIAMAISDHTGFERFLLGSVTNRVLRTAPCAVMVIKSKAVHGVADDA